jgi:hypothetical protein
VIKEDVPKNLVQPKEPVEMHNPETLEDKPLKIKNRF